MSDITHVSSNKKDSKSRLGRGLGSLLKDSIADDSTPASVASGSPQLPATETRPSLNAPTVAVNASQGAVPQRSQNQNVPDTARVWTIPIEKLSANKQQPRQVFDDGPLLELADSIKVHGILQPITAVRTSDNSFEIIAGERRYRAAQLAGLKEVPVLLKEAKGQKSLELAILENIQRADLNPMEEAEAYDLLMTSYGLTQAQVAERLGKERSSIANALRLLSLPPEVKLMLSAGELSTGHAKVLLSVGSLAQQIDLAKQVIREKLSVRALEKQILVLKARQTSEGTGPNAHSGAQSQAAQVSSQMAKVLAEELQKMIGTRVAIDYTEGKGRMVLHFHSDEQLNEIVDRMRAGWLKT